ncbi:MAG: 1-acyl-sn-glycerol-3-phosphate acyltransferase [Vampirovibrio sp.]|nr:1-acyl-sn-glycerol-3-phosphate acyltransferase [Vampirovibrio sp.]
MAEAFLPPKLNPLLVWVFRLCRPLIYGAALDNFRVEISKDDLALLKSVKDQRLLLLPNHPSADDPFVMFEVSRQMGTMFNYVAAREVFDCVKGLQGWFFQQMGVYSVIRGKADRESFAMTRHKLVSGERPLVIFIEGEVSYENDDLIPFQPGVLQLAFKAQEELVKLYKDDPPGILVAPVGIKYIYGPYIEEVLKESLTELETEMGLGQPEDQDDITVRIRRIAMKILETHEARALMPSVEDGVSLNERIDRVRERLLTDMETFLHMTVKPETVFLDRIRNVRNEIDRRIFQYQDESNLSPYDQNMVDYLRRTYEEFVEDLERLVNFMTLKDGYLNKETSPERLAEVIIRFQREVFGKIKLKHPRTAKVVIGECQSLKNLMEPYQADKRGTAETMAQDLEQEMMGLLERARTLEI